jgi:hypothetical protein
MRASDILDLFFRPKRFFEGVDLDRRWWYLTLLLLVGISTASGRIDSNLMRADLGRPRSGWEDFAPLLTESWVGYWLFVLAAAVLSAVFYWYVRGWWYKVRLRWSGAEAPDPRVARLVLVSASLVASAPVVAFLLADTVSFPDYQTAWSSEGMASSVLLVFPFWSLYASYRGARTRFDVAKWRARIWFFILPFLMYTVSFGIFAVLYALVVEPTSVGGDRFASLVLATATRGAG